MDRYNKNKTPGFRTITRFCTCGRSEIIASDHPVELAEFEARWTRDHTGLGHEQVDFDRWIAAVTAGPLALAS